jgi:hypothetical protein
MDQEGAEKRPTGKDWLEGLVRSREAMLREENQRLKALLEGAKEPVERRNQAPDMPE